MAYAIFNGPSQSFSFTNTAVRFPLTSASVATGVALDSTGTKFTFANPGLYYLYITLRAAIRDGVKQFSIVLLDETTGGNIGALTGSASSGAKSDSQSFILPLSSVAGHSYSIMVAGQGYGNDTVPINVFGFQAIVSSFAPAADGTTIVNNADGTISASGGGGSNLLKLQAAGNALYTVAVGTAPNARGAYAMDLQSDRTAATQVASGADSVALGLKCTASGANALAIGQSTASAASALAISQSTASAASALAIGQSTASSANALAIGQATAVGASAIAIGNQAATTTGFNISIGYKASTKGTYGNAVAIGTSAYAYTYGIAIGRNTRSKGGGGVSIGIGAYTMNNCIAIGAGATAISNYGFNTIAIGYHAEAVASHNISIGNYAKTATNTHSMAIGDTAKAYGSSSIAIGHAASSGNNSYAIALGAYALADELVTFAVLSHVLSQDSIGIFGHIATSSDHSVAIGAEAGCTARYCVALGANSYAVHANSVAIGNAITTKNPQEVNFGNVALAIGSMGAGYASTISAPVAGTILFDGTNWRGWDGSHWRTFNIT